MEITTVVMNSWLVAYACVSLQTPLATMFGLISSYNILILQNTILVHGRSKSRRDMKWLIIFTRSLIKFQ